MLEIPWAWCEQKGAKDLLKEQITGNKSLMSTFNSLQEWGGSDNKRAGNNAPLYN